MKTNFVVITGGPGGGKSSLLNVLSRKGFKYINETGRAIIKDRINKGLSPRPDLKEFAKLMFQQDYQNYIDNINASEILFFDRSFIDSALFIQQTDKSYFEGIRNTINTYRFNNNVFMTPPWKEIYCNDDERDQTFDEAIDIYEKLKEWYKMNGYQPIILPKVSVERRAEFILSEIKPLKIKQ